MQEIQASFAKIQQKIVDLERQADVDENAIVGLEITNKPPHSVLAVHHIFDYKGVEQDEEGYANPPIMPGDRMISVDHHHVKHATKEQLHQLLSGLPNSLVEIDLVRGIGTSNISFSVSLLRHVPGARPGGEADTYSLLTPDERQGASQDNPQIQSYYGNSMERARALATELMLSGTIGQATNTLYVIPRASSAAHLAWRT